jgi:hypothetical protein
MHPSKRARTAGLSIRTNCYDERLAYICQDAVFLEELARAQGLETNSSLLGQVQAEPLIAVCPVKNVMPLANLLVQKPVCYPVWLTISEEFQHKRVLTLTNEQEFTIAKALYNTYPSSNFFVFQKNGIGIMVVLKSNQSHMPYVTLPDLDVPPDCT